MEDWRLLTVPDCLSLSRAVPAFNHILAKPTDPRQGPRMLVLAPTRELANQIETETVKFGRELGMSSTCVYGGAPQGPQLRDLRNGVHIVIATPGP